MSAIHPSFSGPIVRPLIARRTPPPTRHPTFQAMRAYTRPSAVAGMAVPATAAALSAPSVQLNAAVLLPHIEALLAGPFGAPALALSCALCAGATAAMRGGRSEQRAQVMRFLHAAGPAGLGAPLLFGALRAALGPAYAVSLIARGVVFGIATLTGSFVGRQAGQAVGARTLPPMPPSEKIYSEAHLQSRRHAHAQAADRGGKVGGWLAGAIVGAAALRAF